MLFNRNAYIFNRNESCKQLLKRGISQGYEPDFRVHTHVDISTRGQEYYTCIIKYSNSHCHNKIVLDYMFTHVYTLECKGFTLHLPFTRKGKGEIKK